MGNFGVVKWVGWQITINSAQFFAQSFPLVRVNFESEIFSRISFFHSHLPKYSVSLLENNIISVSYVCLPIGMLFMGSWSL